MEIKNVQFEGNFPSNITIEMTIQEAAFLTKLAGKTSLASTPAPGYYYAQSDLYDVMTEFVFNAYFEEGIDEYIRRIT